ncbi:putative long-chain-alcohol O-fatty-acyltransferase 8 [Chlorella vulgaris]
MQPAFDTELSVAGLHLSWATKLALVVAWSFASAAWLRYCCSSRTGWLQLAATLPLFAANAAAPLLFSTGLAGSSLEGHLVEVAGGEPVSRAFTAFLLTWLANFKAVAAAVNRGPLAQQPWTVMQYWALYCLPLVPSAGPTRRKLRRAHHDSPGSSAELLLRWLLKAAVTAAVVFALLLPGIPPFFNTCLYCVGLYTMLGVVMDGPAALLLRPLRLSLAPHFLPPWDAPSLAAFWGTHWNQAASNALRTTLYEPIVQGSLLSPASPAGHAASPAAKHRRRSARLAAATAAAAAAAVAAEREISETRRVVGMAACFLASGAVHELIFWYVQGSCTRHLSWLWFFTGQAPLILLERVLLRKLRKLGLAPPEMLRIVATLGVLLASAHWLFFLPAEAAGVPARFAESMRHSFAALATAPATLLASVRQ